MSARTSRRTLLAGLAVSPLLTRPAVAAGPHPDAALFTHEAEFMRLCAAEEAAIDVEWAAEARAHDLARSRLPDGTDDPAWHAVLNAAAEEVGHPAFEAATHEIQRAEGDLAEIVEGIRATTFEGVRAKARIAAKWSGLAESVVADLVALDLAEGGKA